jgi:outer membrane protein OmpA-like peptidoglycan-associated protein
MSGAVSLLTTALALLFLSTSSFAADVRGSRDHSRANRFEGSTILRYVSTAFDEYVLPLGPSRGRGSDVDLPKFARLEGAVTRITYVAPVGRSTLEIARSYENELKKAGYAVVFAGAGFALGGDEIYPGNFASAAGYKFRFPGSASPQFDQVVSRDQRFLAARLTQPGGDVHVVLYVTAIQDFPGHFVPIDAVSQKPAARGTVIYQLDVIEAKAMEDRTVAISATDMAVGIARAGSIALYGIFFDTNSAEVKLESAPTLQEIATLLKREPTLKLLVVGHTDNVGTFEANMALSQRRADAVVKALSTLYGVDGGRLTPVGVSFASPVGSNKTEEGKARNRRVQLVEP